MSKDYGYVSLPDMQYLLVGLAINVKRCADVLDGVLTAFNQKIGIPDQIVAWNVKGGNATGPLSFPDRGRFIIELTQSLQSGGQELWTAALLEKHNEKEKAPVVFIRMHSPSLDIPTRLEIPLRALMKGGPPLEGTYCVYLHALLVDDGTEFVYYGITKRGWNLRFAEHTRAAVAEKSRRFRYDRSKWPCTRRWCVHICPSAGCLRCASRAAVVIRKSQRAGSSVGSAI
jgi:hypothetical protein